MTSGEHSIPRRPADDPSDFESLRSAGVRLIQELSGDHWTDYNPHDPGITILEVLCYALTDLMYRARFPVADHLASPEGSIAWEDQALYRPEDILPSRPTTLDDLRSTVLDRVPEVEQVWVEPIPAPDGDSGSGMRSWSGVHAVRIQVDRNTKDLDLVKRQVQEVLRSHRNLAEDFDAQVRVAREVECELRADVEIGGGRTPESILADIYSLAHAHVAGRGTSGVRSRTLEETFTGPLLVRGAHRSSLVSDLSHLHLADLVNAVRAVEGVVGVGRLDLVVEGTARPDTVPRLIDGRVLCLRVPADPVPPELVRLTRGGRPVSVSTGALRDKYREVSDALRMGASSWTDPSTLYTEPSGVNRDDDRYRSIQAHFPPVYGVGRYGLAESASVANRARVAQLRAFLLPLEQLLADQMANIRHLRDLFSTADADLPTYWHQPLGDAQVPGASALLLGPPAEVLSRLSRELGGDAERRGRALDHMLAMYGETLDDRALLSFDVYGAARTEALLLQSKIEFLRSLVVVGRDRVGSYDYARPFWRSREEEGGEGVGRRGGGHGSGFQRRVGLLLGFLRPGGRSLVDPLIREGLPLRRTASPEIRGRPPRDLDRSDVFAGFEPLPRVDRPPGRTVAELRAAIGPIEDGWLGDLLYGPPVRLDGLRLGLRGGRHILAFRPSPEDPWREVARYSSREAGVVGASALVDFLTELQIECEGLHVVEHILLRPVGGENAASGSGKQAREAGGWSGFFPHRVSAFFTGWTARGRDLRFRTLAEDTVRRNGPAHVHVECFWLDARAMAELEDTYRRWLATKVEPAAPSAEQDAAAAELIRFIQARRFAGLPGEAGP